MYMMDVINCPHSESWGHAFRDTLRDSDPVHFGVPFPNALCRIRTCSAYCILGTHHPQPAKVYRA